MFGIFIAVTVFGYESSDHQAPENSSETIQVQCISAPEPKDVAELKMDLQKLQKQYGDLFDSTLEESLDLQVCESYATFLRYRLEDQDCGLEYPMYEELDY